ncbi:MAG: DUF5107 domain-containing protein [Chitinophagaceae bacterium]|nr:DUF5107 domain-containing protein [Chitinophagaceae bacterium]
MKKMNVVFILKTVKAFLVMQRQFCFLIFGVFGAFTVFPLFAFGQSDATVKEVETEFVTYPYSDPDPVANTDQIANDASIYPYFRYDGFTIKPVKKSWKVVELENDYLKLQIIPEIGGKIWSAIDKKNGKPFIYNNNVVKFRDLALRGPWTSGGIETNFGIFGHAPTVATPLDYFVRSNSDGSASCIISSLDLLTRSIWTVEIRLPKDKAYFLTHFFWHNYSPLTEPYYTWMNLAIKASDSLHLIGEGTFYIGHNGNPHSWPIDTQNGRNLSIYGQNNFGGSKSYHIIGKYSKYFGAFWPEENYGMIHYSDRDDKPGKKVFLWALSDAGKIWENLLTDHSGQYVEMQSGRLFNQNAFKSSFTPFKQKGFLPYQSDEWTEYWYPFSQTDGVDFADLNGVYKINNSINSFSLKICALREITDELQIFDDEGNTIFKEKIKIGPLETLTKTVTDIKGKKLSSFKLGTTYFDLHDVMKNDLSRPVVPPSDFDWNSAFGLYLLGRDALNQRAIAKGEDYLRQSLQKDHSLLPAIVEMSSLQYRKLNFDSALFYAKKGLAIDTYDPEANFIFGLASKQAGNYFDALDAFEIASLSSGYRSAAFTELSKMYFSGNEYEKAHSYAVKALRSDYDNMTALQLKLVAERILKLNDKFNETKDQIVQRNPLNHFVAFEFYWKNRTEDFKEAFVKAIRSELPDETYLEMAIWYFNLGRTEESKDLLKMAPQKNNLIEYWQAFLDRENPEEIKQKLSVAEKGSPKMMFPFREETQAVMEWAMKNTADWKPGYYSALIQNFRNNKSNAKDLLGKIETNVEFAPFYITRSRLYNVSERSKKLTDLKKAIELDENEWRYKKELAEYYLQINENENALQTVQDYYKSHSDNYIIGMIYIKALMANNRFDIAEKVLTEINILPFENATIGHLYYLQTKLMLALNYLENHQYKKALKKVSESRLWPLNLGVGKPYDDMINTNIQDDIESLIKDAEKNKKKVTDLEKYRERIRNI